MGDHCCSFIGLSALVWMCIPMDASMSTITKYIQLDVHTITLLCDLFDTCGQ